MRSTNRPPHLRWRATLVAMLLCALNAARAEGKPVRGLRPSDAIRPGVSELSADVIYSASKRLQYTQEAPSMVQVFTRRQIAIAGYRSVNELLASIAGIELVDTGKRQYLLFRGVPFTALVLLDGVSIVSHVDNLAYIQRLPIEIVEKVEVVLSPGSVIWGAHAVYGVVNVITRRGRGRDLQRVAVSGGWWRTLRGSYSMRLNRGGLRVQAHLSAETTSGPTLSVSDSPSAPQQFGNGGDTDTAGGLTVNGYLSVGWRGLFVQALARMVDSYPYGIDEATGALQGPNSRTRFETPLTALQAGYRRRFTLGSFRLRLHTAAYLFDQPFAEQSQLYPRGPLLPRGALSFHRLDRQLRVGANAELQARYRIWTALLGVDGFRSDISGLLSARISGRLSNERTLPDASALTFSAYTHHELRLLRDLNLAVGARVNASDSYAVALLLSANAVYEPIDGLFIKASYADGFRPPSFYARFSSASQVLGATDLDPERSRVVEGQLVYERAFAEGLDLRVGAGYAYSALLGLVGTDPTQRIPTFANLRDEQLHSVSAFARFRFGRWVQLNASYAHHIPVAEGGVKRSDFARDRLTARVSTRFYEPLTISVGYLFNGSREVVGFEGPGIGTSTLGQGAYHLLDATVRYRLLRTGLALSATFRNLLAQDYDHTPPYTHISLIYRGPFPRPDTIYGFFTLEYTLPL